MVHFPYEFPFCAMDVLEHHGLKIIFHRSVEQYLFHFITNNLAFFGILANQRPIHLPPMIAAAISSIVVFDDAP